MALEALLDVLELQGGLSQKVVSGAPADRTNVVRSGFIPPCVRDKSFLKGAGQPHSVADKDGGPLPGLEPEPKAARILSPEERSREPPRRLPLLDRKVPVDASSPTKLL